jgi:hypothetical protein
MNVCWIPNKKKFIMVGILWVWRDKYPMRASNISLLHHPVVISLSPEAKFFRLCTLDEKLYQTLKSICGEIRDDRPYTHCNISNTN